VFFSVLSGVLYSVRVAEKSNFGAFVLCLLCYAISASIDSRLCLRNELAVERRELRATD
jgi:hypothetical protein